MSQNVHSSSNCVLPSIDRSFTVTPSPENYLGLSQEKEQKKRKEKLLANVVNCSHCTTAIMVGIGTLLAALAMYIGCSFQSNTTIQQNRFSDDKIARLNNIFYEEKRFFFTPKIKETKFLHAYKEAIGEMKQCQIDTKLLRYFYGESGIGKTTMLHEVLKDSKPFPYTLLRLESGNSWKEVGVKLNITSINEHATEELVFRTLTEYFNYLNSDDCPLIIIDGANRNPKITNTFIAFWRDISHVRPFALLMISSDGFYPSISRGGGRVIGTELSPSETFVREYLEAKGIVDPSLVSEIMEITGNKIVYLSSIRSPRELNILEQTVYENFEENLMELKRFDMAFQYFKNLVKVLLENPQQSMAALDVVPDKEAAKIFKSNLLRRYGQDYRFQNKAVERFFKRKWKINSEGLLKLNITGRTVSE